MQFLVRVLVGGLLIASIGPIARQFGPRVAGLAVLVPAVTLIGFFFLGVDQGAAAVRDAAASALWAVPTVAAFLGGTHVALRYDLPVVGALAIGLLCWTATAAPILKWML